MLLFFLLRLMVAALHFNEDNAFVYFININKICTMYHFLFNILHVIKVFDMIMIFFS